MKRTVAMFIATSIVSIGWMEFLLTEYVFGSATGVGFVALRIFFYLLVVCLLWIFYWSNRQSMTKFTKFPTMAGFIEMLCGRKKHN